MPNPYLEAALRAQDERRPKASADKKSTEKKAAESAAKSGSTADKES